MEGQDETARLGLEEPYLTRKRKSETRISTWSMEVRSAKLLCNCSSIIDGGEAKGKSICPRCKHEIDPAVRYISIHDGTRVGARGLQRSTFQRGVSTLRPPRLRKAVSGLLSRVRLGKDAGNSAPSPSAHQSPGQAGSYPEEQHDRYGRSSDGDNAPPDKTDMYRSLRNTGSAGGSTKASPSVSTLLGELSDHDSGRGPRLTLLDTAARLERARRLLNAKARKSG